MTNYTTISPEIPLEERTLLYREQRYKRQDVSARLALKYTGHRVLHCMRHSKGDHVDLLYYPLCNKAGFKNLQTCGSSWDCPICAAKIAARRAEELRQAGFNWALQGGSVFMATFTMRHNRGDRLADLVKAMTEAMRFLKSGAPWERFEQNYQVAGSITGTEITFSDEFGWHYHKHLIFFVRLPEGTNIKKLEKWLFDRYERALERQGYSSLEGIGVLCSEVVSPNEGLSLYIDKWGLEDELTNSSSKVGGMLPFEMLDNKNYHQLFVEYSNTMYGRARLHWSRGLRDLLGLKVEKTDEELVAEEKEEGQVIWTIPEVAWKIVVKSGWRSALLDCLEVSQERLYEFLIDKELGKYLFL